MSETTCARCSGQLVQISLKVGVETVTMQSCSACDHRNWQRSGEPIELGGVLTDLTDNPPPRRAVVTG